jgi:hypothetical protein
VQAIMPKVKPDLGADEILALLEEWKRINTWTFLKQATKTDCNILVKIL